MLLNNNKVAMIFFISSMLIMALTCTLQSSFAIHEGFQEDIRITPEGNVEGTDKIIQNGNLYTLREDIAGDTKAGMIFISIEKDYVTFDGTGHTIQGTGSGTALSAWGRKDLTIKNTRIVNFGTGIEIRSTDFDVNSTGSNNQIVDNYFETLYWGISINTNDGFVAGNTFHSKNTKYGILMESNKTHIANNKFVNGGLVIYKPGIGNSFSGNTINGKPLVCLSGQSNQVIDNANQVILINCRKMIIQNINDIGLRQPIQLFETTNTKITNCQPHMALTDSHSNTIIDNQLTEEGSSIDYYTAAIKLTSSNNNTIIQNQIQATNCFGTSLIGSSYNHINKNQINVTGPAKAAIRLETTSTSKCEKNYIYENNLSSQENGIQITTSSKNNYFFKNKIENCKNAIALSSGHNNTFTGNNISGSTQYAVYISASEYNSFNLNNFVDNIKQAYENHQMYWFGYQNDTYYTAYNKWDNDEKGNYWSDYTGQDNNGDGVGETPYHVYENYSDNYPLTKPYEISKIYIAFEKWVPTDNHTTPSNDQVQITIISPENKAYNTSNIPLEFILSQSTNWTGYSLDGKTNSTIDGNITLNILESGTHNIIIYGNTTQGNQIKSQIVTFTISLTKAPESFPTIPVIGVTTTAIIVGAALVLYFKKYKS